MDALALDLIVAEASVVKRVIAAAPARPYEQPIQLAA
jgi:hypothetical protein